MKTYTKDPNAVLDYTIDWSSWLVSDTIATSEWTTETGLTIDTETETTTAATVWLSSGTAGSSYRVTNSITTVGGRSDDRTIVIRVKNK